MIPGSVVSISLPTTSWCLLMREYVVTRRICTNATVMWHALNSISMPTGVSGVMNIKEAAILADFLLEDIAWSLHHRSEA
jgi:hypothetical protein